MKVFILYLGFGNLLHVGDNIIQLQTEFTLLLLKLLFHSLKVVNLLAEVSYTVCLLLPQCGSGGLMLQSGLFKVSAQLLELSLPLLVHLNLGSSGTSSLLQPLTDLLQLSGQVCSLLLSHYLSFLPCSHCLYPSLHLPFSPSFYIPLSIFHCLPPSVSLSPVREGRSLQAPLLSPFQKLV